MTVNDFLRTHPTNEFGRIRSRAVCADGYSVSIQASDFHYCTPRINDADVYSTVELGYPTVLDEELEEYAEDPDSTQTAFRYVPVEIVEEVLKKHGGIVS